MAVKPKLALIPSGVKASKVYSVLPSDGTGDFDFSRSGNATRVNSEGLIELVTNNVPRLNYPLIDGVVSGCPSLLLEPSRSNYVLKSDDVLSTYQSQNGDVSDASEPINGFNNSIQIEYDAISSLVYKRDFNPTIGTEYTISLFVQMNDNSEPIHTVDANSGDFSLINAGLEASASDIKTERLGSTNVYRVSSTRTATSTNNRFGIIKYSTQSSKGFKVTGFQLEQGSYATSYIPTQGSTVTRVAETCNGAGDANTFNDSEGVLFAEISALDSETTNKMITISNGSNSTRVLIRYVGTTLLTQLRISGANQYEFGYEPTNIKDNFKIAIKYKANDFSFFVNGFELDSSNSGSTFSDGTLTELAFDDGSGVNDFYGNTKQIQYFDTALTDEELALLTSL